MLLLHMLKVSTSSWSLPPSSMLPKVYRTEGHHGHIWGLLIVSYYIFKSNLRYPDLFMCILLLRTYCKDSNKILSSCNLMCIVTPKVATINKLLSQGSTIFVPRPWVIDSPVYSAIWHFKLWVIDNLTAKQFFEWFFFSKQYVKWQSSQNQQLTRTISSAKKAAKAAPNARSRKFGWKTDVESWLY